MLSSVEQVSQTFELLEMILEILEPRKIFTIQSVCKRWQAVIAGSKKIQYHIFRQAREKVLQPFKIDPPSDFTIARYDAELRFNRAIHSIVKPRRWRAGEDVWVSYILNLGPRTVDQARLLPSYMNLFVTEPPICTVAIVVTGVTPENLKTDHALRCSMKDLDGVRIGPLIETAACMIYDDELLKDYEQHILQVWFRMPVSKTMNDLWNNESSERKKHRAERIEAKKAAAEGLQEVEQLENGKEE